MSALELIAGDYGRGRGSYAGGVFSFPRRVTRGIERVAAVEANAKVMQRDWLSAFTGGLKGAAALAPIGLLTGIFVAPLAVLTGPLGMTAAALGAGLGAFGNSTKHKTLMQVAFDDGTGIVAISDDSVPGMIENDLRVTRDLARRQAASLKDVTPVARAKGYFTRNRTPAASVEILPPAPLLLADKSSEPGLLTSASELLTSGSEAVADATASAASAVYGAGESAYSAAEATVGSALTFAGDAFAAIGRRVRPDSSSA